VPEPSDDHHDYYSFDESTGDFVPYEESGSSIDLYTFDYATNSYAYVPETNPYIHTYYTYDENTGYYNVYTPGAYLTNDEDENCNEGYYTQNEFTNEYEPYSGLPEESSTTVFVFDSSEDTFIPVGRPEEHNDHFEGEHNEEGEG
jgi:hypothetical protein